MGVGKAIAEKKHLEEAVDAMKQIAGQKPVVTLSRKSIANFKLREGMPIGCKVTLRGKRMCEFLDRLISLALPRVRDFRGLDPNAFDGHGNYNLGLTEQLVFPELNPDKFTQPAGHEHHAGHQRRQRRRGPRVAAAVGHAAAGGVSTATRSVAQRGRDRCRRKTSTGRKLHGK